ncbi:hypothetical protein NQZ68_013538 [Dissostichus eleginoides]|nr:hypothetical protein NQZ68_013538 [Dissostichus eleginoides]
MFGLSPSSHQRRGSGRSAARTRGAHSPICAAHGHTQARTKRWLKLLVLGGVSATDGGRRRGTRREPRIFRSPCGEICRVRCRSVSVSVRQIYPKQMQRVRGEGGGEEEGRASKLWDPGLDEREMLHE